MTSSSALVCPACARPHGRDERFCGDCGMPLVHAPGAAVEVPGGETRVRARKVRPELTRGPLVRVAGGRNQAEAEMIQNLLLEEGVPSLLRRSAGFDVPDFLAAGPRDVYVAESGAEIARLALSESELDPVPPAATRAVSGAKVAALAAGVTAAAALAALVAWALIQVGH